MRRYTIPTAESFRGPIAEDEFDIDMAKTGEEKQQATDARASKLWRTLRIASKSKLNVFDKIDDGNNLQALFQSEEGENKDKDKDKAEVEVEVEVEETEQTLNQPSKELEGLITNGAKPKEVEEDEIKAPAETATE